MSEKRGTQLGPPHAQVGCFERNGLLRCERREIPAARRTGDEPSRRTGDDPSRRRDVAKPSGPSKRDADSEAALASRFPRRREDDVRLNREAQAALGFPDPPRFGSLIQSANRPPPDMGMQWRERPNQLLVSKPVGLAVSSEKKAGQPAPRVVPPVPVVASLMYSN